MTDFPSTWCDYLISETLISWELFVFLFNFSFGLRMRRNTAPHHTASSLSLMCGPTWMTSCWYLLWNNFALTWHDTPIIEDGLSGHRHLTIVITFTQKQNLIETVKLNLRLFTILNRLNHWFIERFKVVIRVSFAELNPRRYQWIMKLREIRWMMVHCGITIKLLNDIDKTPLSHKFHAAND